MTEEGNYCVFISYAWGEREARKKWVYNLANRLMTENGIDVKVDLFDLKIGSDKDYFMEQMLCDEVDYVLIICDKMYQDKANKRSGGVGIETQIITPEVYNKVSQTKVIPIVAEIGDSFDSYVPKYLRTRICIDMSSIEAYEDGYEKLLRHISQQPEYVKPKISGSIPSFNSEDHILSTTAVVRALREAIVEEKNAKIEYNIQRFIKNFLLEMEKYKLTIDDIIEPFDELIYSKFADMIKLRNDYITFIEALCINKSIIKYNIGKIKNILERSLEYNYISIGEASNGMLHDHYRLFNYEIFLYTLAILLRKENYSEAKYILGTVYFYKCMGNNKENTISVFISETIDSIDECRKRRLKSNKLSLSTDMIMGRSRIADEDFKNDLVTADLLAYYTQTAAKEWWFPRTYYYYSMGYTPRIFFALKSKREFEKLKELYGVDNAEGMREWLMRATPKETYGYSGAWERCPSVLLFIKPEEICKYE